MPISTVNSAARRTSIGAACGGRFMRNMSTGRARCTSWVGVDGSGRSTISALRSARRGGGVVVELDLARGALAWRAGIQPRTTIADLTTMAVEDVTADAIAAATWRARCGTRVLPGPCCPEVGEAVTPLLVGRIIRVLMSAGNDVHVDAAGAFDARVLAACSSSSSVRLVGRRTPHSLAVASRTRDLLGRCGVHDVEAELGGPVAAKARDAVSAMLARVQVFGRTDRVWASHQ